MSKMRAAVFAGIQNVEIREYDKPVCDKDKLLVKTEATAMCTYEQRVFKGTHKIVYPKIYGHEVAGVIEEVGDELKDKGWEVGQKVIVGATLPCGSCYYCRTGNAQQCVTFDDPKFLPGQPLEGTAGMSEYMMQQPRSVFKYYNVTPEEASLVEPLSCVLHSVETVNPQFGDFSVIVGAGIMGLFHALLCLRKGNAVIIIDMNEERLKFAKELGVQYTINPDKEDAEARVIEITNGLKAANVFDTTPIAAVAEDAVKYVGNTGKLMIYSGIYPNKPISIDPHWVHKKGIQIMGSANSNSTDFIRAAQMISYGVVDVKPFISGVYPVTKANEALESACKGDKFRVVLKMDFDGE